MLEGILDGATEGELDSAAVPQTHRPSSCEFAGVAPSTDLALASSVLFGNPESAPGLVRVAGPQWPLKVGVPSEVSIFQPIREFCAERGVPSPVMNKYYTAGRFCFATPLARLPWEFPRRCCGPGMVATSPLGKFTVTVVHFYFFLPER